MVNLITEKITYPVQNNGASTSNIDLARAHKDFTKLEGSAENIDKQATKLKKSQLVFPLSMLGSGGILLYLGLRTPSSLKLFKKGIDSRLFQMENVVNSYCNKVENMISEGFTESKKYVQDYIKRKCIKPSEYLAHFQKIDKPDEIIVAKDLAMRAITSVQKGEYNGGPCEFDVASGIIRREKNELDGRIFVEAGNAKTKLCDYVHVPKFADGKYANKVAYAEAEVSTRHVILDRHIINTREQKLGKAAKEQYEAIADAVLKSREMASQAKKLVIDVAFKKMKKTLPSFDLKPSYDTRNYFLGPYSELTTKELKPQLNIPNKIKNAHKNNIFIDVLQEQDFNELSEENIRLIFYNMSEETNLNDLRYLIDSLRLEHEVAKSKAPKKGDVYRVMIAKLQNLANELQSFGEKELFEQSAKNFDELTSAQKPAKVHSIVSVAKRLGYDALDDLELYFLDINKKNPNFNISKYLNIFLDNPENYFV